MTRDYLILGIETSCDETAAAVISANDRRLRILSNVIASQIPLHRATGGVVPEVAAREHVLKIMPVIDKALHSAGIKLPDIDVIAATYGPGLASSLVIGGVSASTLAAVSNKPLVPVNHIEGHIYSNFIEHKPKFPIIILTVSGGHNDLVLMKSHSQYKILGETLDDAAGEAFDKGARILGLGYPGGPAIEKTAQGGNPNAYHLPRALMTPRAKSRAAAHAKLKRPLVRKIGEADFSFSGLKTALLYLAQKELSSKSLRDLAASFQEAVCDALSERLVQAVQKYKVDEAYLAGGVSANLRLRELTAEKFKSRGIDAPLYFPKDFSLCTDNAAMIAAAGYFKYLKNPAKFKKIRHLKFMPSTALEAL